MSTSPVKENPAPALFADKDGSFDSPANSLLDFARRVLEPPTMSSEDLQPHKEGEAEVDAETQVEQGVSLPDAPSRDQSSLSSSCTFDQATSAWGSVLDKVDELEGVRAMTAALQVQLTKTPAPAIAEDILREGTRHCLEQADALLRVARERVERCEKDIVCSGGAMSARVMARVKLDHAERRVRALQNEQSDHHEQMTYVRFRSV